MSNYILDEHGGPQLEPDIMTWSQWFETADRTVARTQIGDVVVSTVFLGFDHNFGADGPPLLFETMVFGGALDEKQQRYRTRDEASEGHQIMVDGVREAATQEPQNAT